MSELTIEAVLACPSLPSLPAVALQVLELAREDDVRIDEIARVVERSAFPTRQWNSSSAVGGGFFTEPRIFLLLRRLTCHETSGYGSTLVFPITSKPRQHRISPIFLKYLLKRN